MIGSHDSFSNLPSTNPIYNLFTRLWRTQCLSILEQYNAGVRFFDIRVCWHKGKWNFCHGLAKLKGHQFKTLDEICDYIEIGFPDALYRIVLERGDSKEFLKQTGYYSSIMEDSLCYKHPNLWRVDIKSHGRWNGEIDNNDFSLYNQGYNFATLNTWEAPCKEAHGKVTVKNFYKVNLMEEARECNSQLGIFSDRNAFSLAAQSKDYLYLLDYCTGDYDD